MSPPDRYPLAPNPVWWTLQGEAHLRGFQMAFLRLGGCSVGCPECDTDYGVSSKETPERIAEMVDEVIPAGCVDRWVWITGGEPADYDLRPLLAALRKRRMSIAVATSGHKRVIPPVDWLSVSPHKPGELLQTYGNEVKLVEGLHGLDLNAYIEAHPDETTGFMYRYVQPLTVDGKEDPDSLNRCLAFLATHPSWALSRQDHIVWGVR